MPRSRYSPEEIERGLTALILAGSSVKAEPACGIKASTLREWKMDHPDQYARLQKNLEPQIVDKIAGEAEGIVLRLSEIQHGVIDQFEATMHDLKPAELAAASRNLATTSALYVDKHSSPLRERPSHVQTDTGTEQLMTRMLRLLGNPTQVDNQAIESTATTLPSAAANPALDVERPTKRA